MAEESIAFLYGINTTASLFHMNEKNIHMRDLSSTGNLSRSSFKLSQNFSLLRTPEINNKTGKRQSRVGFRLVSVCRLKDRNLLPDRADLERSRGQQGRDISYRAPSHLT